MALTKEEIIQLHQHGRVFREGKMMGKIPFVIRTFTVEDNLEFAKGMDNFRSSDSNLHVNNAMAQLILSRALVSVNNVRVDEEYVKNALPEKCNYILKEWNQLTADVVEYLKGYPEKELALEEIEEYILTDTIVRTENLGYEDDMPRLTFRYRILSVGETAAIGERLSDLHHQGVSRLHASAASDRLIAAHMIEEVNGVKVDEETIDEFNTEIISFIMNRAAKVEEQMRKVLQNPEQMGEQLKN